MQIDLARLIREKKPRGVQIELTVVDHLRAVHRALGERPLSSYVALEVQ
jgi:hypothetical protein